MFAAMPSNMLCETHPMTDHSQSSGTEALPEPCPSPEWITRAMSEALRCKAPQKIFLVLFQFIVGYFLIVEEDV